jgi:hypothetical protein
MTDTLALGVWKGGHPARATLPRDRTLHVTVPRFRPKNRPRRIQWNIVESPEDPIQGGFVAEQAARLISPPRYLPADRIVQDVQLQQFVEWTRGGRMRPDNSWADRHRSFDLALRDLAALDHPPVVVETGAMRAPEDWAGAGMSTYLFGAFLHNVGGTLHSVEIDPETARFAQQETACFGHTVKIHYRPSNVVWRLRTSDGPNQAVTVAGVYGKPPDTNHFNGLSWIDGRLYVCAHNHRRPSQIHILNSDLSRDRILEDVGRQVHNVWKEGPLLGIVSSAERSVYYLDPGRRERRRVLQVDGYPRGFAAVDSEAYYVGVSHQAAVDVRNLHPSRLLRCDRNWQVVACWELPLPGNLHDLLVLEDE